MRRRDGGGAHGLIRISDRAGPVDLGIAVVGEQSIFVVYPLPDSPSPHPDSVHQLPWKNARSGGTG